MSSYDLPLVTWRCVSPVFSYISSYCAFHALCIIFHLHFISILRCNSVQMSHWNKRLLTYLHANKAVCCSRQCCILPPTNAIRGSSGPPESSSQMASWSVQAFCRAH